MLIYQRSPIVKGLLVIEALEFRVKIMLLNKIAASAPCLENLAKHASDKIY